MSDSTRILGSRSQTRRSLEPGACEYLAAFGTTRSWSRRPRATDHTRARAPCALASALMVQPVDGLWEGPASTREGLVSLSHWHAVVEAPRRIQRGERLRAVTFAGAQLVY